VCSDSQEEDVCECSVCTSAREETRKWNRKVLKNKPGLIAELHQPRCRYPMKVAEFRETNLESPVSLLVFLICLLFYEDFI
jgi:hypothetical protein